MACGNSQVTTSPKPIEPTTSANNSTKEQIESLIKIADAAYQSKQY